MASVSLENGASRKRLVVASKNPVKVAAALQGFQLMFPGNSYTTHGVSVPSGVSDQPFADKETLQGAINRAENVRVQEPDADYWIGIEGGVEDSSDQRAGSLESFAWVVVIDREKGNTGKARTAAFYQPDEVAKLVRTGMELGHADDVVFGTSNSKQSSGSVGLLTGNVLNRESYYVQAVILALIPFRNRQLTF